MPLEVTAPRTEVKIPVPMALLSDVRAWIQMHPMHWRQPFPPRQINNIYLDSPTSWGVNANLSGVGDRAKLRLRWYGECVCCIGAARLELKRRLGTAGWKEIYSFDAALDLRRDTWTEIVFKMEHSVPEYVAALLLRYPMPVLINAYQREYYATPDEMLRLTVDYRLRAYGQRSSCVPNLSRAVVLPDEAVIELKAPCDPAARRRLDAALSYFPLSVDRFSKYVQGVLATSDFG